MTTDNNSVSRRGLFGAAGKATVVAGIAGGITAPFRSLGGVAWAATAPKTVKKWILTKNVGDDNKLTADQIAQVKLAELELQKQAQELGLNFAKLEVDDRKSAREMQATTRSIVPPVLAGLVTLGFFGILIMMLMGKVDSNNPAILMMLGSLGTAWTGIIAYYFGSSAGSQAKTDLLSKAPAIK